MKKRIFKLIIPFLFITLLVSCTNRQSNYFIEGVFSNAEYKLVITVIDYETFKINEGRNVVTDESFKRKNQYYQILLYKIDNEEKLEMTFYDLTLRTVTTAEPCYYLDKNDNSIAPHTNQQVIGYEIEYDKKIIHVEG